MGNRTHNLGSICLYTKVKFSFRNCDRIFIKAASVLWNNLPLSHKLATTLGHFKSGLKTYLYTKWFKD